MNIEIKFRAWDKERNKFIYSDWKYGVLSFWETICNDFTHEYEAPQQYTGLKDKNGKDIYEGDILKLFYPRNYVYMGIHKEEKIVKIEFQSGGFWFNGQGVTDCNWHFYNEEDREIIGNIYETPELIK